MSLVFYLFRWICHIYYIHFIQIYYWIFVIDNYKDINHSQFFFVCAYWRFVPFACKTINNKLSHKPPFKSQRNECVINDDNRIYKTKLNCYHRPFRSPPKEAEEDMKKKEERAKQQPKNNNRTPKIKFRFILFFFTFSYQNWIDWAFHKIISTMPGDSLRIQNYWLITPLTIECLFRMIDLGLYVYIVCSNW